MAGTLGLRYAFSGQRVQPTKQRPAKLAQRVAIKGAAVTQRLKPGGKGAGTQRLAPKQAPSGTQIKKKVSRILTPVYEGIGVLPRALRGLVSACLRGLA